MVHLKNAYSIFCLLPFTPHIFFLVLVVVVEGEWVGCVGDGVKKQEVTARPKETHLQPEIPSFLCKIPTPTPQNQQKTKKEICHQVSPMANIYLTRGDRINLRTRTLTHNRTLRPVSLSVQEKFFFFFFLFCLFFLSSGVLFFYCWEGRALFIVFFFCVFFLFQMGTDKGKGLIVRECLGGGV